MSAPIIRSARVNRSPIDAFRIFTTEIGAWWPLPTHGLFGERSGGISFRDGHIIEISVDGTEAIWGRVETWDPPNRLVLSWHPGRAIGNASTVDVQFVPDGDATTIILEHSGWERFGEDEIKRRRSYVGPNAWGYVLDHFADGVEPRVDAPDLRELASAYEAFFSLAESGSFGPAPDDEWDADQTIAHVALNDLAIIAVCQTIVHGGPAELASLRFENAVCQDRDVLASWIESADGRSELISRGRSTAIQMQAALNRLAPEKRDTMVDCRLSHDGELMVDDPRPWGAIAITVQSTVHLPAHIDQLTNLAIR